MHVFDSNGKMILRSASEWDEEDPFLSDASLYTMIKERTKSEGTVIEYEQDEAVYFSFCDKEENLYVGGPVCTGELSRGFLFRYRKTHHLTQKRLRLPALSLLETANLLSIAIFMVNGTRQEEMDLLEINHINAGTDNRHNEMLNYRQKVTEAETGHIHNEYEQQYLADIREGRVEKFQNVNISMKELTNEVGILAENNLKQSEYMIVAGITLVARAAMEGGVPASSAYSLSEIYMQRLAKCRSEAEMYRLYMECQREFAGKVKKIRDKKRNAYYVEQCKDYLTQNIHKKVTVQEIADLIGINRTYLSGQFSKQVGMTISQYSIAVRLKAAENMLKFSEAPVGEIAEYLCFASQSHFGKCFREKYGISPAEYRKQHKIIDFISK